jgi:hypothetical protein
VAQGSEGADLTPGVNDGPVRALPRSRPEPALHGQPLRAMELATDIADLSDPHVVIVRPRGPVGPESESSVGVLVARGRPSSPGRRLGEAAILDLGLAHADF